MYDWEKADKETVLMKVKKQFQDECRARYKMTEVGNEDTRARLFLLADPESIKSFIVSLFLKMQGIGSGLAGSAFAVQTFKEYLEVSLNIEKAELRISGLLPLDVCQHEIAVVDDEETLEAVIAFMQIVDLSI